MKTLYLTEPTEPLRNRYGTLGSLSLSLYKIYIYIGRVPRVPHIPCKYMENKCSKTTNLELQNSIWMNVSKNGTDGTVNEKPKLTHFKTTLCVISLRFRKGVFGVPWSSGEVEFHGKRSA